MRLRPFLPYLALTLACASAQRGSAQAAYTAIGPGSYITAGIAGSAFNADYGQQKLAGAAVFVDTNPYRRIGLEFEARTLQFHATERVKETTLLAGPKISSHGRTFRPYAKLLAGRGYFNFPFGYARGSYFVVAPGAGLDVRLGSSRFFVRVLDVEYQLWPQFTFGYMHPIGVSSGLSVRVF